MMVTPGGNALRCRVCAATWYYQTLPGGRPHPNFWACVNGCNVADSEEQSASTSAHSV
jgi:hypothetical protein